ncbi:hypothetical protein ANO11243_088190 [Dothideomycetidae sp. 11243]|nr:hypothetical protein ANO11243_088190 [fungal sp. No.11243]
MDPLSAVSLACNVTELLKTCKTLYKVYQGFRGGSDQLETLRSCIDGLDRNILSVHANLREDGQQIRAEQKELYDFATKCAQSSRDLKAQLDVYIDSGQGKAKSRRWDAIVATARYKMRIIADTHAEQLDAIVRDLASCLEAIKQDRAEKIAKERGAELQRLRDEILKSLFFPEIKQREEQISEAYQGTFEWIFERKPNQPWDSFPDWLRLRFDHRIGDENRPYWISGKAGSGKSTLMRWLLYHTAIKRLLLDEYGSQKSVIMLSHFFFSPGNDNQKTIGGMLRALLYQLLEENLGLEKTFASVSSRPEVDLKNHFEGCPSLRLQDLTREDLSKFFSHNISEARAQAALKPISPSGPIVGEDDWNQLSKSLVDRANGIFLWAKVIMKSIARGIRHRDPLSTLYERMDALPNEVDEMFRHMLQSIETVYRQKAAEIFTFRLSVSRPLLVAEAVLLEREKDSNGAVSITQDVSIASDDFIENHVDVVETLLRIGADANCRITSQLFKPLMKRANSSWYEHGFSPLDWCMLYCEDAAKYIHKDNAILPYALRCIPLMECLVRYGAEIPTKLIHFRARNGLQVFMNFTAFVLYVSTNADSKIWLPFATSVYDRNPVVVCDLFRAIGRAKQESQYYEMDLWHEYIPARHLEAYFTSFYCDSLEEFISIHRMITKHKSGNGCRWHNYVGSSENYSEFFKHIPDFVPQFVLRCPQVIINPYQMSDCPYQPTNDEVVTFNNDLEAFFRKADSVIIETLKREKSCPSPTKISVEDDSDQSNSSSVDGSDSEAIDGIEFDTSVDSSDWDSDDDDEVV